MHRISKLVKTICCIVLLFSMIPIGEAEKVPEIIKMEARDQIVRVCLTRLGGRNRLDLTFTAPYVLKNDKQTTLYLRAGSKVTFQIENNSIYLYYQEMSQELGEGVTLFRSNETSDLTTGFYITHFPELYMGDLALDIEDGHFRSVLGIHVEDYLLGVVPYEMGEAFPLEALKAQAVAARTYALRSQGRYKEYDLLDNTNDQVFKGYIPGNKRSEQAVWETQGICGYDQGKLAQCYYSASNGGQTELVQTVWSSREGQDYYSFGADPYDIANPESMVRRYQLNKKYPSEKEAPLSLREMLAEHLSDALSERGYSSKPDLLRVDEVVSVAVNTPSAPDSLHMTNLHMELKISVRRMIKDLSEVDTSPEEVHIFLQPSVQDDLSHDVNENASLPSETSYTSFIPVDEIVVVDIPIFPDAEKALSLSISSNYQNEIWSVVEEKDMFVIEVRRYGHGVGMSQRGAQWMAAEHDKTYQEILAFYYPGMSLVQYPEQERRYTDTEAALVQTAGPAPSPTPRPTLMPVSLTANAGQWFAAVTEIADDSSLNLRAAPTLNSEILMRLYKGQRLLVVEKADEEGWVYVQTDTAEGYVMEKYLTAE